MDSIICGDHFNNFILCFANQNPKSEVYVMQKNKKFSIEFSYG